MEYARLVLKIVPLVQMKLPVKLVLIMDITSTHQIYAFYAKVPASIAHHSPNVFLVLTENTMILIILVNLVIKIAQNAQDHQQIAHNALVVIY